MEIGYFANRIATVMKESSNSHVFFLLQQAFDADYNDDLQWEDVEKLLGEIIAKTNAPGGIDDAE